MRVVMLGLVLVLTHVPARAAALADVPFDHWAYQALDVLIEAGLLPDYPDGLYRSSQRITRYEVAVAIIRACDELDRQTQPGATATRPDKLSGAAGWIYRLAAEFTPEPRLLDVDPEALQARARRAAPFADVPLDHWAYQAVASLAVAGVLRGYPGGSPAQP